MSYVVAIMFICDEFPLLEWETLMSQFDAQRWSVDINVQGLVARWVVQHKDKHVHVDVEDLRDRPYLTTNSARWGIFIERAGHHPNATWLQFAIPYYALTLFNDVVFYDLQHDKYINNIDDYSQFTEACLQFYGRNKMFELGLLDGDGHVLFDVWKPL